MPSESRVLVLTGASRGIGRFLAEHYAADGWIVAGCSRSRSDFDHPNYRHDIVDITDEREVVLWISSVAKEFGGIYGAINNAGTASMNHSLLTPGSTVTKLMNLNFNGTFYVSREAAKVMQKKKVGRIVNFSSVATSMALEGESIYAASKSAVTTFSRAMAREVSRFNITINVVAPPPIKTNLIKGVPEETMKRLVNRLVIPRFGEFSDVANVIDFFLSPASSMVTGQAVTIGGW